MEIFQERKEHYKFSRSSDMDIQLHVTFHL